MRDANCPTGPSPSTSSVPPSGTFAYSTPCHAVGRMSLRNRYRSSGRSLLIFIALKSAWWTVRSSACPPGIWP
jgi:hypothetical protein